MSTDGERDHRWAALLSARQELQALLARDQLVQVPAVYDGITALLAQEVGFPALFVSGNGVAASLLGAPDVGLVTLTESVAAARGVAGAVRIPVLHDGDSGYGTAVNVTRMVREVEAAGLAGVTLEDQATPKRCGLLDTPPPVVGEEEYLGKIEAAVCSRTDGLVVVARTDALRSQGIDAAARRGRQAVAAGADAVLVVGLREPHDVEQVATAVQAPLVVLVEETGSLARRTPEELQAMGVRLAVYPGTVRYTVAGAVRHALRALRRDGTSGAVRGGMVTAEEWNALTGVPETLEVERRFVRGAGPYAAGAPDTPD